MRNPQQSTPDHPLILATFARSTPFRGAGEQPGTVVRVSGAARPVDGAPLTAPLSGLPCVWFRAITAQGASLMESTLTGQGPVVGTPSPFVRSDMGFAYDDRTTDVESDALLRVVDSTGGGVLLDPRGADVDAVTVSVDRTAGNLYDQPYSMQREWIIEPDTPVFALGEVATAPEPTLHVTAASALVLSTHGEQAAYQRSQGFTAAGGRPGAGPAVRPVGGTGPALRLWLATAGGIALLVVIVVLVVVLG